MGDFKNIWRDLKEARRLSREQPTWRGLVVEVVSWLIVFAAVFAMLKWLL